MGYLLFFEGGNTNRRMYMRFLHKKDTRWDTYSFPNETITYPVWYFCRDYDIELCHGLRKQQRKLEVELKKKA